MTLSPSRIALIPSSFYPRFGGVEEHTRHVARLLLQRGYEVEVWTVALSGDGGEAIVDGVRVRYLPCPLPTRQLRNLGASARQIPRAIINWLSVVRRFRPDLLHVQCFGPNGVYAMATSVVTRVPLLLSAHGETFMDDGDIFGRSTLMRRALRRGCRTSAAVTACSQLVAADLRARFGAVEVAIVPNGVEGAVPRAPADARAHRVPTIVAVGRLVHVKGFDLLLRALAMLSVPATLVLVGDGPERQSLHDLATQLGVDDRVQWLGSMDATEVQEVMARGDVVAMPSRREAFGIVALEAWASGTPLVATSLGGPAHFVTHGVDGILANPEDPYTFSQEIESVLRDPHKAARLAEAGRKSVECYTWSEVVKKYIAIYESVGGRHQAN